MKFLERAVSVCPCKHRLRKQTTELKLQIPTRNFLTNFTMAKEPIFLLGQPNYLAKHFTKISLTFAWLSFSTTILLHLTTEYYIKFMMHTNNTQLKTTKAYVFVI